MRMSRKSGVERRVPGARPTAAHAGPRPSTLDPRRSSSAFTLLEVMIAAGILFMCLFAILAVLAGALRNARALQHRTVDAGMRAGELSVTNRLTEGSESGDFGDVHEDFRWEEQRYLVASNGLYEVDIVVYNRYGRRGEESRMSILLFDESGAGGPGGMPRLGAPRR